MEFFDETGPIPLFWAYWLYGAFGGKIVRTNTLLNFAWQAISNSFFFKNTCLVSIFVLNHTSPIFLAKRTRWHEWGQMCPGAKFRPSHKTRFRFEFSYYIAPHIFCWPNGLYGAIGGKSAPERSFVHPKKHVFGWNFLIKPAPYLFSGPNWLYGASGGKIIPDESFAQFCLKSPLKFVFPKNTFSVWIFVQNRSSPIFLAKWNRCRDWGKKCPEAKFRPS